MRHRRPLQFHHVCRVLPVNQHLARANERLALVQHRLDLAFQHDSVVHGIGLVEALAARPVVAADRGAGLHLLRRGVALAPGRDVDVPAPRSNALASAPQPTRTPAPVRPAPFLNLPTRAWPKQGLELRRRSPSHRLAFKWES